MNEYFFIVFINFLLKGKQLIDYTNLFAPKECKNNYKIVQTFFQDIKSKSLEVLFKLRRSKSSYVLATTYHVWGSHILTYLGFHYFLLLQFGCLVYQKNLNFL